MKFKFSHKVTDESSLSPKPSGLEENQAKAPQLEDNVSTLASSEEAKTDSSSSLEEEIVKPSVSPPNTSPAIKPKKSRPHPVRPKPEERLAALVSKHPMTWDCKDVGDWLECLGFAGKYRKAFTHHAIAGPLLPKLTDSTLKEELGVTSLGHREMLLGAIASLFECWTKEEEKERANILPGTYLDRYITSSASPLTTPKSAAQLQAQSPVITIGSEMYKAQERCTRLSHDLEKATSRAANLRAAVEKATRNADLADKEVERLSAALKEAEIEAQGGKFGMAVKKSGKNLQSPVQKKGIPGVDETKFMDRLQADIQNREKKAKLATGKGKSGSKATTPAGIAATGEAANDSDSSFKSCLEFLSSICAEKDPSFTESLEMPGENDEEGRAKLSTKLDELVGRLAGELGIDDKDVEIVKNAKEANKKAQKLTVAVKKAIFMQHLDQDLSAREQRRQEIKEKLKAERVAAAKAAEEKDLKEANAVFAKLGWPVEAMQGGSTTGDDLLGALLKRLRAAQAAKAAGKAVDWGAGELHKDDGLLAFSVSQTVAPIDSATPAAPLSASGPPVLQETVNLLSQCHGDELDRLETLKGTKKLLATYRALRAQEFIRTSREKLEAKVAKAAEYQESQKPERKILPKEAGEAFLQRLSEEAARRAKNREELQTKAREEEKQKAVPVLTKGKSATASKK